MPRRSSTLLSAKMLRASSSTSSTVRPTRSSSELVQPLQHALLLRRQVGDDAVQEQRGLVEQPLGRFDALHHDAARHGVQLRVLLGATARVPVNTTTGTSRQRVVVADLLQHLEAGHVGQPQIEHHAVERLARAALASASAPVPAVTISMSSWPSSSRDAQLLGGVVLDHQQPLAARLRHSP